MSVDLAGLDSTIMRLVEIRLSLDVSILQLVQARRATGAEDSEELRDWLLTLDGSKSPASPEPLCSGCAFEFQSQTLEACPWCATARGGCR